MKEYVNSRQKDSRTLNNHREISRQAPLSQLLQAYRRSSTINIVQYRGSEKRKELFRDRLGINQQEASENVLMSKNFIQLYRPDGAPPITREELALKHEAIMKMASVPLEANQYFHCTTTSNYMKDYGIMDDSKIRSVFGGKRGADEAVGGAFGAALQRQDRGFAFASRDPLVISEYYELHLARSIIEENPALRPIILVVTPRGAWEDDPAQRGAIRTQHSFDVVKRIV